MKKYRKKPIIISAYQWFSVEPHIYGHKRDVDYYRKPNEGGAETCQYCSKIKHLHGWMDTLEGGHIVCPGDWIITGVNGEKYPCKPDVFEKSYEEVTDG